MSSADNAEGRVPALVVTNLHKQYEDRGKLIPAVDGVTFRIEPGEFYTLLGESGCGKTTTLRCVAGLERTDAGQISLDGVTVNDERPPVFVSPNRRDIGMVFQNYAIWPHMSAFDNVAFPLRRGRKQYSRHEVRTLVEEALAAVELSGYESRMATQMSGGQQQRLALARALVRRPKLLLLDEPLSNLDAKLREAMRTEIRRLHRRLGVSLLYVTHDQVEALSMSTRIGVMADGRLLQEGTPREIYQRPGSRAVAGFVGRANFLECILGEFLGDGAMRLCPRPGAPRVGELLAIGAPPLPKPGGNVTVAIRPENVVVHAADAPDSDERNRFAGTVQEVTFLGESLQCRVDVDGASLLALLHPTSTLTPGDPVTVVLPPERCAVIGSPVQDADAQDPPGAGHGVARVARSAHDEKAIAG